MSNSFSQDLKFQLQTAVDRSSSNQSSKWNHFSTYALLPALTPRGGVMGDWRNGES
jgi:hypothetical protein